MTGSDDRTRWQNPMTGSDEKIIESRQESLKPWASLLGIIATIEIPLRNTVTRNLDRYFGNNDWLQSDFNR